MHKQCLLPLAMILSSCRQANCVFLLRVLPGLLKGTKVKFPFLFIPVTCQLNNQFSAHYLEAVVYMLVTGALQVSREGDADPCTKGTNCPVLMNKSCPSVTFTVSCHQCVKNKHKEQEKRFCCQDNLLSLHVCCLRRRDGPCRLEDWEHYEEGCHKMADVAL